MLNKIIILLHQIEKRIIIMIALLMNRNKINKNSPSNRNKIKSRRSTGVRKNEIKQSPSLKSKESFMAKSGKGNIISTELPNPNANVIEINVNGQLVEKTSPEGNGEN